MSTRQLCGCETESAIIAAEVESELACGVYSSRDAATRAARKNIAIIKSAIENAYGEGYVAGSNYQLAIHAHASEPRKGSPASYAASPRGEWKVRYPSEGATEADVVFEDGSAIRIKSPVAKIIVDAHNATHLPRGDGESDGLLPCPFCDNRAEFGDDGKGGQFVTCANPMCQASSKLIYPQKTDAKPLLIEAWNNRADTPRGEQGADTKQK